MNLADNAARHPPVTEAVEITMGGKQYLIPAGVDYSGMAIMNLHGNALPSYLNYAGAAAQQKPPAPRTHLCEWCATPEGVECAAWCPDRPEILAWLMR